MPFKKLALLSLLLGSSAGTTFPLRRRSNNPNATAPMVSTEYGTVFDVEATIGGQTFQLLVDSGSSDLYVMKTGFTCLDKNTGLELSEEECGYDLTRTYNVSDTYEEIPNQIFGIEYGAGIASGVMAFEEVTIAGVTVPRQRIAVADKSTPMGDGVNSGLLGLGYPSLTSAHPSNITDNTTYWFHRLPYKPILYEMYDQGLIKEPYFAHVLARSPLNESGPVFGGYLSLGELPPVEHSDNWAVAPVEVMNNIPLNFTSYKRTRSYWALTLSASLGPNSTRRNSSSVSAPFQAFLDSGNPLSYIPSQIADPLNNLFSPPGVYNKTLQAYVVDCNAEAPASFSLEIDGQTFTHDPADLIYQTGEGVCISAIGNSDEIRLLDDLQLNVIGVPFLKSVLSVFDIGKNEMRFAKLMEEVASESGNDNDTDGAGDNEEEYTPGNDGQRLVPGGVLGMAWCLSILVCAFTF
ncbi:hypothetical protein BDW71DRAFT_175672 [Aspergillus fruticulosus]